METKKDLQFIVIDDDPVNNHICRISIGTVFPGTDIKTFTDPQLALDYILAAYPRSASIQTIMFLDINMPVLNGWDVLNEFMKLSDTIKKQFKIYILSSSVSFEDKQKAKKCPLIVDFIEKPLTVEVLKDLLPE